MNPEVKIHTIIEVHEEPYFRKMKVESGYLYNFWDENKQDYSMDWIFVNDQKPISNE